MQITLGTHLDGSTVGATALGEVTTGPAGLLDILETRLGLTGTRTPTPVRIVQYQRCLRQADDGTRFYSRSFQVDALAVATELLSWRDEWVAAGWNGDAAASASQRLRDMAHVETVARAVLAAGVADRLQRVRQALPSRSSGIDRIRLADPLDAFTPAWRALLSLLPVERAADNVPDSTAPPDTDTDTTAPQGTAPTARKGPAPTAAPDIAGIAPRGSDAKGAPDAGPIAPQATDLAALQHALMHNQPVSFQGDGTCFLLRADSEQTLARIIAGAVATGDAGSPENLNLITGRHGHILDQVLAAAGLPQTGQSPRSPSRPAPQILRLALSLLWQPLDPYRLLEFLTHPVSPLNRGLRTRLAAAVAEAPGIGGPHWIQAVDKSRARAVERAGGDPDAAKAIDAQLALWLDCPRHDRSGAPLPILAERCAEVSRWAAGRAAALNDDDPLRSGFLAARAEASAAATALDELAAGGLAELTQLQLDRLIDQVTQAGSRRPDALAQCGHLPCTTNPGAVIQPAASMVWWDFSAPALPRRWPWSAAETAQLAEQGAHLPDTDALLQAEARTWLKPVLSARRRLVLVLPARRGGEDVVPHPLWDQIVALDSSASFPVVDADELLKSGRQHPWLSFATDRVAHRPLPAVRRWWRLENPGRLVPRDTESYSSLASFVNAPHRWVLRYRAHLKPGSVSAVTSGNRHKGELLHRWFEWLFNADDMDWRSADRATLATWADRRFPELLAREGANFLLPGRLRENEELRAIAIDSALDLFQHLRDAGVDNVQVEYEAHGRFRGGRLGGRIDLLVRNAQGNEAVVDMKWSGLKYRTDELRANRHLQLATYAVMRRSETGQWPAQAYFVLAEPRLVAQAADYFPRAAVFGPEDTDATTQTLWVGFEQAWQWRRQQMDQGWVEIVTERTVADERSIAPDGAWQPDKAKDSFDDYVRLVGWADGA